MLGVWLPSEELAILRKEAKRRGVSIAQLIREAIERIETELTNERRK